MLEANKPEYFVDGFLIKHFGIYPAGFDKENLLEEQKIFLIYLICSIPSVEDCTRNFEFQKRKEEIKINTKIKLSNTDIDVCKMQGRDIQELKKERLIQEKNRLIAELKKEYGIQDKKEIDKPESLPEGIPGKIQSEQAKLWEMLQGKGLINGLQHKDKS